MASFVLVPPLTTFGFRIHTGYGEIVSMVFVEVRYEQSVDFLKTAIDRAFAGKPLCYSRSRLVTMNKVFVMYSRMDVFF